MTFPNVLITVGKNGSKKQRLREINSKLEPLANGELTAASRTPLKDLVSECTIMSSPSKPPF